MPQRCWDQPSPPASIASDKACFGHRASRIRHYGTIALIVAAAAASTAALAASGEVEGGTEAPAPRQVVEATESLIAEIGFIRRTLGVSDSYADVEPQSNREPVHVYAKTLEILHKVRRLQAQFGLTPAPEQWMPFQPVNIEDAIANLEQLVRQVRGIRDELAFDGEPERAPVAADATLSTAYERLASASLMLDGLRGGPPTSNDLFQVASAAFHGLEAIAKRLNIALDVSQDAPPSAKPVEIASALMRSIEMAIDVQAELGMVASAAPYFTPVRVTASELYDLTGLLTAELSRIGHHAGIAEAPRPAVDFRGKTLTDLTARIEQIHQGLAQVADDGIRLAAAGTEEEAPEAGRQRQDREPATLADADAAPEGADALAGAAAPQPAAGTEEEAQTPCAAQLTGDPSNWAPQYPRRGRRDLGSAKIEVRFQIDENGEVIEGETEVLLDQSSATRQASIGLFAEAAVKTVNAWRFEFEEPEDASCGKSQTVSVRFDFVFDN